MLLSIINYLYYRGSLYYYNINNKKIKLGKGNIVYPTTLMELSRLTYIIICPSQPILLTGK